MRNRDHIWKSADGRQIRLEDMEDSHLINLLCWFYRQRETLTALQVETGLQVPRKSFQGADIDTWVERLSKELNRRRMAQVKEAYNLLGKDS